MTAGTTINTGTGNVTVTIGTGAGNTNTASDDITAGRHHRAPTSALSTSWVPATVSMGGTTVGGGADMASVTATGNLTVVSTGDISQHGALSATDPDVINVAGTTRLTAAGPILLSNNNNHFTGTVTYTDPGGEVTIAAAGNLTLGSPSAVATLTAAAGGILDSQFDLGVSGAASFTGGTITLSLGLTGLPSRSACSSPEQHCRPGLLLPIPPALTRRGLDSGRVHHAERPRGYYLQRRS